jgi:hypothetical protein
MAIPQEGLGFPMTGDDRRILPADFGARHAARFYLYRLAILGALILLAALVPAAVVLLHRGGSVFVVMVVGLVMLGLLAVRSLSGEFRPLDSFAATAQLNREGPWMYGDPTELGRPRWSDFLRMVPVVGTAVRIITMVVRMLRAR